MKKYLWLITFFILCFTATAQKNIIFETDMGNDVDDALAIDMLYKYHSSGRINLMAVMLNKEGKYPPMFIDLLNTWYGQPTIPIGVSNRDSLSIVAGANYTEVVVNKRSAKGKPIYKRTLKKYDKLPDAYKLYRQLLSEKPDHSVTIVSVGFSTNLALLLESTADEYSPLSGKELIAQKVDRLVVMAGHFEDPQYREYNVVNDISACQKVYAEWPTDIYTSGFEVGLRIKYPAKSIENDFKWTENHPITDAYKSYLAKIEDRPTWDLTAVLFAIDPGSLFNVSPAGRIAVTDEGCTHFTQDMQGNRYYLKVTDNQCKNILRYFLNMIPRNPEDYKKLK